MNDLNTRVGIRGVVTAPATTAPATTAPATTAPATTAPATTAPTTTAPATTAPTRYQDPGLHRACCKEVVLLLRDKIHYKIPAFFNSASLRSHGGRQELEVPPALEDAVAPHTDHPIQFTTHN
ncbi:hypothetical protein FHG87_005912 [Trinorchestia longiramus]|nr:hypothetical protein FHG87_005912 [Trinorchestia longiramus]